MFLAFPGCFDIAASPPRINGLGFFSQAPERTISFPDGSRSIRQGEGGSKVDAIRTRRICPP
ncbi:MAG: hypothetical protein LBT65_01315 [Synergistaceae bacterium]|nr:hypothetical protein [Synergistaceae bacterium]